MTTHPRTAQPSEPPPGSGAAPVASSSRLAATAPTTHAPVSIAAAAPTTHAPVSIAAAAPTTHAPVSIASSAPRPPFSTSTSSSSPSSHARIVFPLHDGNGDDDDDDDDEQSSGFTLLSPDEAAASSSSSPPLPRIPRPPSHLNRKEPRTRARQPSAAEEAIREEGDDAYTATPTPILVDNIMNVKLAVAPLPPPPHSVPGLTLSHRAGLSLGAVFLEDAQYQACERQRRRARRQRQAEIKAQTPPQSTTQTTSAAQLQQSQAQQQPSHPSEATLPSPTATTTPAATATTPAATLATIPLSPSPHDPRQDASIPDATTPTPQVNAATTPTKAAATTTPSLPAWSQPKSWAGLVSKDSGATSFTAPSSSAASENDASVLSSPATRPQQKYPHHANGTHSRTASSKVPAPSTSPWAQKHRPSLQALLADAHTRFGAPLTVPRGLINTGNFCFANAILQVLVFCAPFYNLFVTIGQELSADFANATPLMEAVVQFLREFQRAPAAAAAAVPSIADVAAAPTANDAFMPEFVYEAMKLNKRFDLMRRGHQEDAEEFLGFFLDTLHEELLAAIRKSEAKAAATTSGAASRAPANGGGDHSVENGNGAVQTVSGFTADDDDDEEEEEREVTRPVSPTEDGWLEVGQKGKTAFTRTTSTSDSPITRIFGGKLRSVLRTPGAKDSVTLEPYQPLQLDIQPCNVQTIEDALLNLTVPETIPGVYSPARGGPVDATKQVFIERTPPVLILHLKRFFYDEVGGVQKNTKEVGYSDVLDVGGEMVSPAKRAEGPTRYRLFGVVYHHGRYATGGHYTVDVLRQDRSGWVHFDDTTFNPVASEHVGRRAGQGPPAGVGHDGLAYLLFYIREDERRGVAASAAAAAPASASASASASSSVSVSASASSSRASSRAPAPTNGAAGRQQPVSFAAAGSDGNRFNGAFVGAGMGAGTHAQQRAPAPGSPSQSARTTRKDKPSGAGAGVDAGGGSIAATGKNAGGNRFHAPASAQAQQQQQQGEATQTPAQTPAQVQVRQVPGAPQGKTRKVKV